MNWYVAPLDKTDPTVIVPDTRLADAIMQAPSWSAGTILVGLPVAPTFPPATWTALTVAQAQTRFESVMGRAPTSEEIY